MAREDRSVPDGRWLGPRQYNSNTPLLDERYAFLPYGFLAILLMIFIFA